MIKLTIGIIKSILIEMTNESGIFCECGSISVLKKCYKPGPNEGRQFLSCSRGNCKLFKPVDGRPWIKTEPSQVQDDVINCECGVLAVKRQVKKNGPNFEKYFWCCTKGENEKCKFFKWDEVPKVMDESKSPSGGEDQDMEPPKKRKFYDQEAFMDVLVNSSSKSLEILKQAEIILARINQMNQGLTPH